MLGSLTFPGSSLERGTLRKHLFNDRLCRIEFCGRKQRKRPVRSGGSNQTKKTTKKNKFTSGGQRRGRRRARGSQVTTQVDARPPSARPDFQPAWTNQEAISLIGIQTKLALRLHRNVFNYTAAKNRSQKESHTWDGS